MEEKRRTHMIFAMCIGAVILFFLTLYWLAYAASPEFDKKRYIIGAIGSLFSFISFACCAVVGVCL
jgi:succinate dehydrogenase hydrophobic anchor subunit